MGIQPVARTFFALVSCLAAAGALARPGSAELRGRVTDEQGAALPAVSIVIKHQESGIFRQAATTGDGSYYLAGVVPGTYEVGASSGLQARRPARRAPGGRQDGDDRREDAGRRREERAR